MIIGPFRHRTLRFVRNRHGKRAMLLRVFQHSQRICSFPGLGNADHHVILRQEAAAVNRNARGHRLRADDPALDREQILPVDTGMVRGPPRRKNGAFYIFGF